MKSYLITWKHNSGFRHTPSLIRGSSFPEAMKTFFHKDAINAVQTYEEINPYFLNIKTSSFQYPLPVTIYYTQHGNGKIYLKWVDGMLTEEINKAIQNTSIKSFNNISSLAKDIYSQINKG